ncbi:uncharacterized protein LOC111988797 [Quercus suber]|uniref:uncharacterized protein LOC111988797 n=1 Tax=Quercus suber TaxID=58331 RepID=UPI0032E01DEA
MGLKKKPEAGPGQVRVLLKNLRPDLRPASKPGPVKTRLIEITEIPLYIYIYINLKFLTLILISSALTHSALSAASLHSLPLNPTQPLHSTVNTTKNPDGEIPNHQITTPPPHLELSPFFFAKSELSSLFFTKSEHQFFLQASAFSLQLKKQYILTEKVNILVIPVTTVASEAAFSTSGRLLSPHRSRLHPKTIEAMMCAQNWLWSEINGSSTISGDSTFQSILDDGEPNEDDGSCATIDGSCITIDED